MGALTYGRNFKPLSAVRGPRGVALPWAWNGLKCCIPMIDGAVPRDLINGHLFTTKAGNALMVAAELGMSAEGDGTGDCFESPTNKGIATAYPFSVVAVLRADDFDGYTGIFQLGDQDTNGYEVGLTVGSGKPYIYANNGSGYSEASTGVSCPTGEPVLVAWTFGATAGSSAAAHRHYIYGLGRNLRNVIDVAGTDPCAITAPTAAKLRLGGSNNPGGGYYDSLDGRIFAVYQWDRVLSRDEIVTIARDPFGIVRPKRFRFASYKPPAGGGGGVTGDASPSFAALTISAAGTVAVQGAAAANLPALTDSAAGTVAVQGAATPSLPALTSSATGAVAVQAAATPSLPALAITTTGTVAVQGAGAGTLPALTPTATGTVAVQGAGTPSLPALTLQASGGTGSQGDAALNLPHLTLTASGTVLVQGAAAPSLPPLGTTATGAVAAQAAGAGTLGALTVSATGAAAVRGAAALTLPALQVSATVLREMEPFETENAAARDRTHTASSRERGHTAGARPNTWTAPRRQD